jgi:hypothetical protein
MKEVTVQQIADVLQGPWPEQRLLALFQSDAADRVEVEPAIRESLPKAA